jgi:hypothetical protein
MLGPGVGLGELVGRRAGGIVGLRVILEPNDYSEEVFGTAAQTWSEALESYSEAVQSLYRGGHGFIARRSRVVDFAVTGTHREEVLLATHFRQQTEALPEWEEFDRVMQLADRIDSFLAGLECRHPLALARDCRNELDLLGVLADWCDDAGLPHAAAEARHLHGLACSFYRG